MAVGRNFAVGASSLSNAVSAAKVRARRAVALAAAVAGVWGSTGHAGAATKTWDPGATDATVVGGTGNWDTTTANWTVDGGASNTTWTAGTAGAAVDDAVFGGTVGTVTLTTGINAQGLTFNSGYTVTGNTLTLNAGATINVANAADTATIASILASGATASFNGANTTATTAFTKTGAGTLSLTGTNTFGGDIVINAGTLVAANSNALSTFNPPAGAGGTPAAGGSGTNPATRVILTASTATFQITTGYDANGGATFDEFLIGGTGGRINVASGQTLQLNDAGQFGDAPAPFAPTAASVFTKTGAGTILLQTQTFATTFQTVISDGTIRVEGANNLGTGNNPITVNGTGAFDIKATLAGSKPITISGAGFGGAGALLSTGTGQVGPVTLAASSSIGGSGQLTVGAITEAVSGSNFVLTKVGAGMTILAATGNTWGGNTIVSGGTLRDTGGTSFPATTNITLNGGSFGSNVNIARDLGTAAGQVQIPGGASGFSANGGAITVSLNSAATLVWGTTPSFNPASLVLNDTTANNTLNFLNPLDLNGAVRTVSSGANTATIGTLISNSSATAAGLTKTGAGTLVLGNAGNTYNGTTTINGGTLSVATLPDGATSPIGSTNVAFTGAGTFQYTGATAITTTRTFTIGANNGGVDVSNAAGGLDITTAVAGGTGNTFTKAGAGTLTLSGTADNNSLILNATAGTTLLNKTVNGTSRAVAGISNIATGATVRLVTGSHGDQIYGGSATGAAGLVNLGGGTLDLNGKSESIDRLTGNAGSITNSAAAGSPSTLTVGETSGTGALYLGNINDGASGGTVALVKTGTGLQALAGGGTYSGGTTINAGTLRAQAGGALGTGPVTLNGGTLSLNGSLVTGFGGTGTGYTLNGGPTVAGDVVTLTTATGSLARSIYNNNKVDVRKFSTTFRYDNGTDGGGADGFTFILQNQGLTALGASGGSKGYTTITPSVALVFNIFNNDQTSAGSNGTQNNLLAALDTVPTTLLNLADVTATYDGTTLSFTVTNPGNTAQTITRSFAVDIPTILGANTAFVGFTGGTGGTNAAQTIANFGYTSTTSLAFTNAVSVSGGATAGIDVATSPAPAASVGPLTLGAGSTLNVSGSGIVPNAPYTLTAGATTLSGAATINVAANGSGSGTLVVGNVAGGSNTLTKTGAGVLNLAGAGSSATGAVTVMAGTLLVNTSLTAPSAAVSSGATLGGAGSITGSITNAGTLAPGNAAVGTLAAGGPVAFSAGSTYAAELAAPGTSDVLSITGSGATGALDLTAADTLNVIPQVAVGSTPGTYTIATFASVAGTFDTVLVNGSPAQSVDPLAANFVSVLYPTSPGGTAGQIRLQVANVVPEPAGLGLLGVAAAGLLARRRRRA